MIEINLLPQELKVKPKKDAAIGIEPAQFLYIIPIVFSVLICVHLYLGLIGIVKSQQLRALNNKWNVLSPERKLLEDFRMAYDAVSQDAKTVQQLTAQEINWSQKLNYLSLNLPYGIWFNEITLTQKDLILKGSVISLKKEEMSLINKFIESLKNDTVFFKDFKNLELSSVQRTQVSGYDVVTFALVGTLK